MIARTASSVSIRRASPALPCTQCAEGTAPHVAAIEIGWREYHPDRKITDYTIPVCARSLWNEACDVLGVSE